jgi:hypothetical protein
MPLNQNNSLADCAVTTTQDLWGQGLGIFFLKLAEVETGRLNAYGILAQFINSMKP